MKHGWIKSKELEIVKESFNLKMYFLAQTQIITHNEFQGVTKSLNAHEVILKRIPPFNFEEVIRLTMSICRRVW